MKKIQSILAGLLGFALLTCSASAMDFPDVPKDSDYATAIANISDIKIMVGDSNGNFNPDQIVSRAEMAAIICRMLGTTENLSNSEVFTDVSATHWANACVGKAAELGVVNGYGNGKFGPSDPVAYEQAVTMIIRAIGDDDRAYSCGGYPNGYFKVAEEHSLLEGVSAVQGQGLTRGSVAILLNNHYMWCPAKPEDGHTHHYEEKVMHGSGTHGHHEKVQTATKTVNDYGQVTVYGCNACSFTTYDYAELQKHCPVELGTAPHAGVRTWSKTTTEVIGTHEEPIYEDRWVDSSETTIRICTLCGQMEPSASSNGHTHHYVEKTVSGTGGHYEEVQVQAGTKTVNDYATVTTYHCKACGLTTTNSSELMNHISTGPCVSSGWWSATKNTIVGTHEEPNYETRTTWVDDSATIIRVCSICGQEEET